MGRNLSVSFSALLLIKRQSCYGLADTTMILRSCITSKLMYDTFRKNLKPQFNQN